MVLANYVIVLVFGVIVGFIIGDIRRDWKYRARTGAHRRRRLFEQPQHKRTEMAVTEDPVNALTDPFGADLGGATVISPITPISGEIVFHRRW